MKSTLTTTTVPHVSLKLNSSFSTVTSWLELNLGRFDADVLTAYADDPVQLTERLKEMQGAEDLMIFNFQDHGLLLSLYGKAGKAIQYLIGNPLIAASMTHKDIRAALYAPLKVLIYEGENHAVYVEYDLPSSQFGQFDNDDIRAVGESLDIKITNLISQADQNF